MVLTIGLVLFLTFEAVMLFVLFKTVFWDDNE
jgi:hypothetical protein